MMVTSVQLSGTARALIDARLDTIDRMLLGRVSRSDRLAIAGELEAQILELLQGCEAEEPGRDDVLAVLARLDPPEAYLPEEPGPGVGREVGIARPRALVRKGQDPRIARASGIVGISSLVLGLLIAPVVSFLAIDLLGSVALFLVSCLGLGGLALIGSVVGLVLAAYSRFEGAWSFVGVVSGFLTMLAAGVAGIFFLLQCL